MRQSTQAEQVIARSILFAEQLTRHFQLSPAGLPPESGLRPKGSGSWMEIANPERLSQISQALCDLLFPPPSTCDLPPEQYEALLRQLGSCATMICDIEQNVGWTQDNPWKKVVVQALLPLVQSEPTLQSVPFDSRIAASTLTGSRLGNRVCKSIVEKTKFRLQRAMSLAAAARLIGTDLILQWLSSTIVSESGPRNAMLKRFQLDLNIIATRFGSGGAKGCSKSIESISNVDDSTDFYDWTLLQSWTPTKSHRGVPHRGVLSDSKVSEDGEFGWGEVEDPYCNSADQVQAFLEQVDSLSRMVRLVYDQNTGIRSGRNGAKGSQQCDSETMRTDFDSIELIESQDAPALSVSLGSAIQRAQNTNGSVSLAVLSTFRTDRDENLESSDWENLPLISTVLERAYASLRQAVPMENLSSFRVAGGKLAFVISDFEKSEVTSLVRESIEKSLGRVNPENHWGKAGCVAVSGIATVSNPGVTFTSRQLIDSAWRCLEAACVQGTSGVKSIQVY